MGISILFTSVLCSLWISLATLDAATLVGHWRFDEGSGTSAADSSGNAYTCTLTGDGVTWVKGKIGPFALQLAGTDDYCGTAANPANLKPTSTFAISVWFNSTALDTNGSAFYDLSDSYAVRLNQDSTLECFYREAVGTWRGVTSAAVTVVNRGWHHVICQKSSTGLELYLDNRSLGTSSFTANIYYPGGESARIGRDSGTARDVTGQIDQVKVYSGSLTAGERAAEFRQGWRLGFKPLAFW